MQATPLKEISFLKGVNFAVYYTDFGKFSASILKLMVMWGCALNWDVMPQKENNHKQICTCTIKTSKWCAYTWARGTIGGLHHHVLWLSTFTGFSRHFNMWKSLHMWGNKGDFRACHALYIRRQVFLFLYILIRTVWNLHRICIIYDCPLVRL